MEETVICRMCLEPIHNFLCVNCLNKTVSTWLSSEKKELLKDYNEFHQTILNEFTSDDNQEKCIKCRNMTNTVLCPYCYVNEVFWWVFSKNTDLARKFVRLFNFDFLGTGYLPKPKTRNLEPAIFVEEEEPTDIGICENCGNTSDNLRNVGGDWLCESCRE